jgi:phospholipase C
MKLLDKKKMGYLNYTDFSQVFGNTMATKLVQYDQNDNYFNNLWPNKETNADNINKQG